VDGYAARTRELPFGHWGELVSRRHILLLVVLGLDDLIGVSLRLLLVLLSMEHHLLVSVLILLGLRDLEELAYLLQLLVVELVDDIKNTLLVHFCWRFENRWLLTSHRRLALATALSHAESRLGGVGRENAFHFLWLEVGGVFRPISDGAVDGPSRVIAPSVKNFQILCANLWVCLWKRFGIKVLIEPLLSPWLLLQNSLRSELSVLSQGSVECATLITLLREHRWCVQICQLLMRSRLFSDSSSGGRGLPLAHLGALYSLLNSISKDSALGGVTVIAWIENSLHAEVAWVLRELVESLSAVISVVNTSVLNSILKCWTEVFDAATCLVQVSRPNLSVLCLWLLLHHVVDEVWVLVELFSIIFAWLLNMIADCFELLSNSLLPG